MSGSGYSRSNTISASMASAGWTALMATATGGCFCGSCEAKARAAGLDWEAILRECQHLAMVSSGRDLAEAHEAQLLRESNYGEAELPLETEAFASWPLFRRHSIDDLFELIGNAIHVARADVDFRCAGQHNRFRMHVLQVFCLL